ncbi:hypothetical protein BOO86_06340 [Mycobacterium sp. CBMA 234]|nr:hypothetical protein [Mycolicibacterium sp. CBMA 234]
MTNIVALNEFVAHAGGEGPCVGVHVQSSEPASLPDRVELRKWFGRAGERILWWSSQTTGVKLKDVAVQPKDALVDAALLPRQIRIVPGNVLVEDL